VKVLREKEKSDIVICLSHSGLSPNKTKAEDEILAKEAPGIDVIVSGHTHTNLAAPIVVGATIIVQAWVLGMQVGVLDIGWDGKRVTLKGWKPVSIDDSIPGTLEIQRTIDSAMREIDDMVLKERGLSFYKILAETNGDMRSPLAESGLGNMVADMIRWYVDKHDSNPGDPLSKVAFAVESNGVLRDDLERGKTGRISVADLFRVVPLGFGVDDSMGYPLVSVYLTAAEIKKALEVVTSVYPLKGSDYFLQVSGVRFTFNPRRMLFDRVTGIWIGSEEEGYAPLDYSRRNTRLYRVVANYYNSAFLKLIGSFTYHILDIVPKDRNGMPIKDLAAARVDADKKKPGIQELKEWAGLIEYVRQFPDTNGDGVPDIPVKYLEHLGRNVSQPSWNPVALLSHGTFVTWTAFGVVLFLIAMVVLAVSLVVRAMKKKAPRVLP
jgi:5'-nucleotidase